MSDTIGRITVPTIAASGVTFPFVTRWPHGRALKRPVITHQLGSANSKIEQRFYLGTPAERYSVRLELTRASRATLRDFWEAMEGCIGSFIYAVPNEDRTTFTNKAVCFENQPLTFEELSNTLTGVGLTFVELVDPAAAPTYTLNATDTRFPGATLTTALLAQVQEIIPLVKIRVLDGAVNDIFLSDRRVTIGSQLYLPRLLRVGEQGSEVLISQSIPTDGNVPADEASFAFGNADRVMIDLANDTNLQWARIELSFFHVGTGIKLDFWAGYITDWHGDKGPEFTVRASDILSALARSSPTGSVSRQCGRRYGLDGCPAVPGSQAMDTTHFPASTNASCDLGYNTPNGCMAHQVQRSYLGIFATPQGVIILDKSSEGGGRLIRPTSIVSDTIYGDTLPEIYHDDEGVAQYGLPVKCKVAAGRDESDYYAALGLIGKGPLGALTLPQMWDQNGDGTPDTFIGATLDGEPNHGFQVDATGHLKPGAVSTLGLRYGLGADPAGAAEYFSLGRVAVATVGLGSARGWYTNPTDSSPMEEVAAAGSAYNKVFAAGMAFLELRRTDQGGIQPSLPNSHDMVAVVSQGLSGYTWSAPGSRTLTAAITNPFWVAINTYLRAIALFGASRATQELAFDVDAAVALAAVADTAVARIFGTGTEKQFQFKGVIDQRRPARDWLQFVLNSAAGYYTWSFGKLKVGCRYNASVASAFTSGNVIFNSLTIEPTKPRFEKLTVKFNDQEYLYSANTVEYVDQDYAVRNARWPAPNASDMDVPGTVTKSGAGRLAVIRAREELGGITQAEQDAARLVAWRTTILGLENEAGQVVSHADSDLPGGTGKFRILSYRVNRDFSIDITGKTVVPSMYDMTVGPKPTDVAASPIPTEESQAPPTFTFGALGAGYAPAGYLELTALGFGADVRGTLNIYSGAFTAFYVDDAIAPATFIALAMNTSVASMQVDDWGTIVEGDYVLVGQEIILIGVVTGLTAAVTRYEKESNTSGHSGTGYSHGLGVAVQKLASISVNHVFPVGYFAGIGVAGAAIGAWKLDIPLPSKRVAAVDGYLTNPRGDSPVKTICLTHSSTNGLVIGSFVAAGSDGYYTLTPDGSGNVQIDLSNGLNQLLVLDGTALTILAPAFTGGTIVAGAWFALYIEQDGTGGHDAPTYAGGAGGFAADGGLAQVDGQAGIRTFLQFTYHASDDRWGLDQVRLGVARS